MPENNFQTAVDVDSIIYLESQGSYTKVYTLFKTITTSKNIGSMLETLDQYPEFIRVHRSYVINQNHILSLKRGEDSQVNLTNLHIVPISKSEKNHLFIKLGIKE